jgi:endonuclease/exonuclease/phosphatase family metal-dependent hydrolase
VCGAGLSFPTWKPQKRIDFVLVKREKRAELEVEVRDVHLMGNTTLAPEKRDIHKEVSSDHLGLWALLALPSSPLRLPPQ